MKRTDKFVAVLLLAILLLMVGCTNETLNNNQKQMDTAKTEQTKQTGTSSEKTEQNEKDQTKPDNVSNQPEQPKYFVNTNYFIKPLDEIQTNKVVLLTFDDAPQGKHTKMILDTLDKHQAKAIFFINGHYAVKNKELLREIYDRGHIIGNHTWWHENLKQIDEEKTKKEIVEVNDLVEEVTGVRPTYFRPPFGVMSPASVKIILDEKMQRMNWTLGSLDWEYFKPEQKDKVIAQVVDNITSGANILMHDKEVTALALDEMLIKLKELGYSFVLPTEVILGE